MSKHPTISSIFLQIKNPFGFLNYRQGDVYIQIQIHNLKTDRLNLCFKKEVISENHIKS